MSLRRPCAVVFLCVWRLVFRVCVVFSRFFFCFFFFKQKTAYEMRISDWSSDVCSSDLMGSAGLVGCRPGDRTSGGRTAGGRSPLQLPAFGPERHAGWGDDQALPRARLLGGVSADGRRGDGDGRSRADPRRGEPRFEPPARKRFYDHRARSEEHTSELQSLMRNSYAVFCLKKKNNSTS